jgi:Fur family ferric uptake transcriptional regulator
MIDRFYRRDPARRACPTLMTHAEELKNSGLKATLPRIKVLEVFQNTSQRHMSAEDVFRVLLADHADIGLATVYRVLMQFEQAGILSRNHFESGKSVFELNEGKHHDHLVCLDCGRVEEFFDGEIEKLVRAGVISSTTGLLHATNAGNLRLLIADVMDEDVEDGALITY